MKACWLWCDRWVRLNVSHSVCRGKRTFSIWWVQIQYKCHDSITQLSTLLSSTHFSVEFFHCNWKNKTYPINQSFMVLWENHNAHKSMAFTLSFCWCISNHKRISFHLVLQRIAKCQVSTCPQFPRLYVNMPVWVEIGFNLNPKKFSAFATYITKIFNSGQLPKVSTAWNEIIHSVDD